jgi:hypothetical protein
MEFWKGILGYEAYRQDVKRQFKKQATYRKVIQVGILEPPKLKKAK